MSEDLIHSIDLEEFKVLASELDREMQKRDHSYRSKIEVRWIIGGMDGGNCWGGEPSRISTEEEPEDEFLTELLEKVAPSITFLKFKRLLKAGLYEGYEETIREYYGNYTEYQHRDLKLDELYKRLRDD